MAVSETIITSLRMQNHQKLHPMSVLRTTVSMLGVFDTEAELDDGKPFTVRLTTSSKNANHCCRFFQNSSRT